MLSSGPCQTIRPFSQIVTKAPPRAGGFGGAGLEIAAAELGRGRRENRCRPVANQHAIAASRRAFYAPA
jgi:hypothetical protein